MRTGVTILLSGEEAGFRFRRHDDGRQIRAGEVVKLGKVGIRWLIKEAGKWGDSGEST